MRGSPARRLSQILDPIARLATDFGSNSAPCSPRLGVRGHEPAVQSGAAGEVARKQQTEASRAESPRLWPRQFRQAPTPPPRPRHSSSSGNNNHSVVSGSLQPPVHPRDSPYVNVPNLLFEKDAKGFAEAARSAGYVELREAKAKCSPYDFTSEPSGHVEYAEKRTFAAQTDLDAGCYDRAGPSPRPGHLDRAYSFSGRQPEPPTRLFAENRLFLEQRSGASSDSNKEKLGNRPAYAASKSFDGYSTAVEELNWQERCLELQLELHRSRSQATRVRDMLREKVSLAFSRFSNQRTVPSTYLANLQLRTCNCEP